MRLSRPVYGIFENGMAYVRWGTGPRTLLYIPGGPFNVAPTRIGARMMFRPVRPLLEEGFSAWYVVNRQDLPEGHSVEDMADDYAELITNEFGGSVDLVLGVSYGGFISFCLAANHGDLLERLAVAVSAYEASEEGKALDYEWAVRHSAGDSAGAFAHSFRTDLPNLRFTGVNRLFDAAARVFGLAAANLFSRRPHAEFRRDVMVEAEAEMAFDARDVLHAIDVPVLLIAGGQDTVFPPAVTEETARLIPDCKLNVYEDRAHGGVVFDKRFPQDLLAFVDAERPLSRSSA